MPRVFLSPLGFHEDILIRALIQLRASRLDRLLVVSCKPLVGGVRRAFDGLKASCSRQDLPEPGLLEVDCSRFYESIAEVRKELGKHEGELILLLGAGLRILSHMLEVAVLVSGRPFKIYYEPESEGGESSHRSQPLREPIKPRQAIEPRAESIKARPRETRCHSSRTSQRARSQRENREEHSHEAQEQGAGGEERKERRSRTHFNSHSTLFIDKNPIRSLGIPES